MVFILCPFQLLGFLPFFAADIFAFVSSDAFRPIFVTVSFAICSGENFFPFLASEILFFVSSETTLPAIMALIIALCLSDVVFPRFASAIAFDATARTVSYVLLLIRSPLQHAIVQNALAILAFLNAFHNTQ